MKLKISDPNLLNNSFSKSTILSIILLIKSFPSEVRIKLLDLLSCGCSFDISDFSSSLETRKLTTDLSIDEFLHISCCVIFMFFSFNK